MLVRRKISIGFVIVGFVLLLSSLIAIFEFYTMKKTVTNVVTSDISSINTSRLLQEIADDYHSKILESLDDTASVNIQQISIAEDKRFINCINSENFSSSEENIMADSVRYAYLAFSYVVGEYNNVWSGSFNERKEWYIEKLYPIYSQLKAYINKLNFLSQSALEDDSVSLSEGFYRSIMPCVVAVGIGIILLFLFNYFLNFYFLNPLDRVSKGINNYLNTGKNYDYNLESDDEMQSLNDGVKEIIVENRKMRKELEQ